MQREFNLCLVLGAVLITLGAAEPNSKLTVYVYNYAELQPKVLTQAEAEASRTYLHSRIEIQWIECPLSPAEAGEVSACKIPPGPAGLVLRMLSQSMSKRLQSPEHSYGFSPSPGHSSFAIVANVFANAAELLSARTDAHVGVFLDQVVAHELGHLLLGPESHSVSGIMHSPWYGKDLKQIAQGSQLFMPWEAAKMRSAISTRQDFVTTLRALRGRTVTERDTPTSLHVAFVDDTFARRFFRQDDPIGKHFGQSLEGHSNDYEIVGVARATRYRPLSTTQSPMYFLPLVQTIQYSVSGYDHLEDETT